jgi:hypothetical protein
VVSPPVHEGWPGLAEQRHPAPGHTDSDGVIVSGES